MVQKDLQAYIRQNNAGIDNSNDSDNFPHTVVLEIWLFE